MGGGWWVDGGRLRIEVESSMAPPRRPGNSFVLSTTTTTTTTTSSTTQPRSAPAIHPPQTRVPRNSSTIHTQSAVPNPDRQLSLQLPQPSTAAHPLLFLLSLPCPSLRPWSRHREISSMPHWTKALPSTGTAKAPQGKGPQRCWSQVKSNHSIRLRPSTFALVTNSQSVLLSLLGLQADLHLLDPSKLLNSSSPSPCSPQNPRRTRLAAHATRRQRVCYSHPDPGPAAAGAAAFLEHQTRCLSPSSRPSPPSSQVVSRCCRTWIREWQAGRRLQSIFDTPKRPRLTQLIHLGAWGIAFTCLHAENPQPGGLQRESCKCPVTDSLGSGSGH